MSYRWSIQNKLTLALIGAALAAVVVAGTATGLLARLTLERRARQAMEPYAQLVSVGADAAVRFEDTERANQILNTLRANPQIVEAAIVLGNGQLLASYTRSTSETVHTRPLKPNGIHLDRNTAELVQNLDEGAHLRILINLEELNRQARDLALMLGVGFAVLLVGMITGLRVVLQRSIIRPIASLAKTVEQVGRQADYRQRVPTSGADEVARLGQNFNAMMGAVEERDSALRELTVFQRTLLDCAASGIISSAPNGTVNSFNPAAERLLGYTAEEVVGKLTPLRWHDDEEVALHAKRLSEELGDTIEPGYEVFAARPQRNLPEEGEWTLIRKDGTRFPALLSVAPLRGENDEITGYIGLVYDLTERKRTEESLWRSEERYRTLVQKLQVAVVVYTADRRIVTCNALAQSLLGLSEDQILGKTSMEAAWRFFREDGSVMPVEEYPVSQVLATGRPIRNAIVGLRRPGKEGHVWVLVNANPAFGEDDVITEVIVTFLDVTERRQAQEKLAYLASIVESSDDAIIGKMLDEAIVSWNRGAEQIYGYTAEEIVGKPISVLVPPELKDEFRMIMEKLERGERVKSLQTTRLHKNGRTIDVALTVSPIKDAHGLIVGASAIARDISERVRAEAEIRQLNQELESRVEERTSQLVKANKELESFAYSVSHDLRAPLRHIDGFVEMLEIRATRMLDDRCRRYMDNISEAAKRMGHLIDDLLSFSRMGRRELLATQVDMDALVREVIRDLAPDYENRNIVWKIAQLPEISGDRSLLRVVMENLISNAIKFTSTRERAVVEVGFEESAASTDFWIRDNGVGFDPEYSSKLFGVFQRLHRDDEFEGTGIGLANVSRIIERHGGRVWAEGQLDQGATFHFSILSKTQYRS